MANNMKFKRFSKTKCDYLSPLDANYHGKNDFRWAAVVSVG